MGRFGSPQQPIRDPSARERRNQAIDDGAQAKDNVRIQQAVTVGAMQKCRHPDLQASEREGHHRHAQGCGEERGIVDQTL